ncbi:undecaprenyldiphospho-muramoylpentapeptide beta-N-acetylglucosaminyltransferase [Lentiprolixibacter aurantiacus]|uniref:UDP-N-acetylglucosamine--N-acetylmuramyl-(pentapeptide) pyrophosphoryl-undecaprenol N-acetylglucosamine transferase n=1 Tax=Lentiprolixibacter aurantiacus TaxID=2993939 RepID=A0AAE3MK83_9FLAO|nr:undecaprenyldiphospho-muramoylpentapeptide beta-N-acetylglucosaminyltransferase [Lentiprolixibacter aurantiacus]
MDSYRFIISGGGTGGHIYPAIAIANALKERYPKAEFLFVGAKDRMEMEKVPQAGYKIKGLWISGLQRKLTLKNLLFPIKLISSLIAAGKIVRQFKPDLVVGTGGFASGPLLRVASKRGIPCVLQEQNSFAGLTNKLLASRAARICVAYDNMERYFPKDKLVKTGNPVRDNILDASTSREDAVTFFGLNPKKKTLLVLGGSLGSKRINELVLSQLPLFEEMDIQLLWQCGKGYFDQYERHSNPAVKVLDFVNRMDLAYAAADLIISRAGASSVSELCVVGKPVIFIPSPNVAEDHQTKNAMALVTESAAKMIKEEELEDKFPHIFTALIGSVEERELLAKNIKRLALPGATEDIVEVISTLLKN